MTLNARWVLGDSNLDEGAGQVGVWGIDDKSTRFLYFSGAPELRGHNFVWPETPLESWFGPSGAMAAQPICNR